MANFGRAAVLREPTVIDRSLVEAIEGPLTVVCPLRSILAGRLLHVLTAVRGTHSPSTAVQHFPVALWSEADIVSILAPVDLPSLLRSPTPGSSTARASVGPLFERTSAPRSVIRVERSRYTQAREVLLVDCVLRDAGLLLHRACDAEALCSIGRNLRADFGAFVGPSRGGRGFKDC